MCVDYCRDSSHHLSLVRCIFGHPSTFYLEQIVSDVINYKNKKPTAHTNTLLQSKMLLLRLSVAGQSVLVK